MLVVCSTVEETLAEGKKLGQQLEAGSVVALYGTLGVGKTVFAKILCVKKQG